MGPWRRRSWVCQDFHLEDAADPARKYPFLAPLLSTLKKRHRTTVGLFIAAMAVAGQARSFAIATILSRWLGTQLGSAVNRFYRLLRNDRVEYEKFLVQWIRLLARRPDGTTLAAVDWTEWHHGLRVFAAAVVVGKRAVPVFVQACSKIVRTCSQNAHENAFRRLLCDGMKRAGVRATLLFDRGFRRVSLISLTQQLDVGFVVRLMSDVIVEIGAEHVPLVGILLRSRKEGPRQSFVTIGVRITATEVDNPFMTVGWIAAVLDGPAPRVIAGRPVGGK